MKKLLVLTILISSMVIHQHTNAQVSITINAGSQPSWGPVGYDYVDYYYIPDIDAYYYVPQQQFIYQERNKWVFARALPTRYARYNLYNGYKVVINEPRPYLRHDIYRVKYKKFKGQRQVIIRDSHDARYKSHDKDNNRSKGNGKKKGHSKHD